VTRVVVLDIEGTTSATEYVATTLFPYARARFASYLTDHAAESRVRALIDDVVHEAGLPSAERGDVVSALERWSDADVKITPLKTLQGWIWDDGFARGELVSHFFPDVIPALRGWHASGLQLAVFSSGSIDAQRAWFGHSPDGDLLSLLSAHFDTQNAGPKREPTSYLKITTALGVAPGDIVFLSDVRAELDAAEAAGWQTVGVRRLGEPQYDAGVGDHRAIALFAELVVTPA
jgi:enolase-phosphatase E1